MSGSKSAKLAANKKIKLAIYGEDKRYWIVFKPIVHELIKNNFNFTYYTSDKDDPCLECKSEYMHAEFIGEGNKGYTRLSLLEADICLMTTPNLDVFNIRRSKGVKHYVHITHAPSETSLYTLYGLDFFDSVLLNGENQKSDIIELENIRKTKKKDLVVVGSSYLDELQKLKNELNIKQEENTVALAPSWGKNAILTRFGEKLLDPLSKSSFHVIIRPHPQTVISEKNILEKLMEKYKDCKNIEWDFERENIKTLSRASALISDFSGVIFDYTILFGNPVMITDFKFDKRSYDASDIEHSTWTFQTLPKISAALQEIDFQNIEAKIKSILGKSELKENIMQMKKEAYCNQGEAAVKTFEFIFELEKRISM